MSYYIQKAYHHNAWVHFHGVSRAWCKLIGRLRRTCIAYSPSDVNMVKSTVAEYYRLSRNQSQRHIQRHIRVAFTAKTNASAVTLQRIHDHVVTVSLQGDWA